ncbi:hypothetical protein [Elizabethkingia anophelis]|uniref:Uncharacterized protein n=2 Tax=Elizabethkingia anophelis TaxID=1117645 RepID=A0A455ZEW9_9FLAO|nr:hypothetical protein [Elizabethkingia anophelis]AIL46948.1 hypothetical protein BD94_3173 [Elizabethkingia anophelis NUHP1]DAC75399.1 TPA_exp: hypothetical protein [Elizabethkingia anophelis]
MEEIRKQVDEEIELALAFHIENIQYGDETIIFLGEFIEHFYKNGNFIVGENLRPALDILIPKLLEESKLSKRSMDDATFIEKISEAATFATHYYSIRDLIYYSFALPNSITWKYEDAKIKIRVQDPTIFRQLAAERISFHLNSLGTGSKFKGQRPTDLLKETSNWDLKNPKVVEAFEKIHEEVDIKIAHFFSYITNDSTVDIGGYKYNEFYEVYKFLLLISMYERYFSIANNLASVLTYEETDISNRIAKQIGISEITVRKILTDIASSSRGTFIRSKELKKYYLLSFSFSLKDSIGNVLKQYARRNSDAFSAECGIIIGNSLVNKVASYFTDFRNFQVLKDVNLQKFGKHLPDIDVAIISYEPSLGFHFFISEIKNSLPASWAKEHLKSIGKKGYIDKAITQIEKLKEFFNQSEGINLLKDLCQEAFSNLDFKLLFPNGFMVVVDFLVVTEQSNGMFFPELNLNIISDDLLRAIVIKSDGDVNFIKYYLQNMNNILDETYDKKLIEVLIGKTVISYEAPKMNNFFLIPQHEYLSVGMLERLEQESIATGYTFIDNLPKVNEEKNRNQDKSNKG